MTENSHYPKKAGELISYLQRHPLLKVKLPNKLTKYEYKSFDGLRIYFRSEDNPKENVSFSLYGTGPGKLEYNEYGFARELSGNLVGNYYYLGDKPWMKSKPDWLRRQESWTKILKVLDKIVLDNSTR